MPRVRPGSSSPGAGGTNPKIPEAHARSAWPSSSNLMTTLATDLTVVVAPNSAWHAEGLAAKTEIAPERAPWLSRSSHSPLSRDARSESELASTARYTSSGPDPMHGFTVAGTSADCRMAAVGAACGEGLGAGLKTA